nr:hypothetical protein [Spelaeicoccus albus]
MAAACVLAKIHGTVVPVGDFSAIALGDDSDEARTAAASLSELAGRHELLLLISTEEHIDASQWRHGKHENDVPAGLALSSLPDELEDLVLGRTEPSAVKGSIDTRSMSRRQASAATMTGERARVARTAAVWILGVVCAAILGIVFAVMAIAGSAVAWIGVAVAVVLVVIAAWRTRKVVTAATANSA